MAEMASDQNCSHVPVKVLPWCLSRHVQALEQGVNDIIFGVGRYTVLKTQVPVSTVCKVQVQVPVSVPCINFKQAARSFTDFSHFTAITEKSKIWYKFAR